MKVINFLLLLPILLISLCPSAKASTIVEKTFPCLTLVTDVSEIDKTKKYVLIADDGENMYAMADKKLKGNSAYTLQLTSQTDISSQTIFFRITPKYSSKSYGIELYGLNTKNDYITVFSGLSNNKGATNSEKPYIYSNNNCLYISNSENTGISSKFLSTNENKDLINFYQSLYSSSSKCLPLRIYEYDASKVATPIGTISIKTAEGYGTYYLDQDYEMPKGVTGYTVTGAESEKLTLEKVYDSGETVPANTALIVYGEQGEYSVFAPTESANASKRTTRADVGTKYLYGTVESKLTPYPDESKSYYFYKLCYLTDTDNNKTLGFYWGEQGGAAFLNTAKRAYMAIEQTTASRVMGFAFPETEPTAIENPTQAVAPHPHGIYTLTGAKLNVSDPGQLPHGIFIVDGRKICK